MLRLFPPLWLAFFFHGMVPGFWLPALTNILQAMGLGKWVAAAFLVPPLCAIVSPVIGGALADQKIAANRLFLWTSWLGAAALGAAFTTLGAGWSPWWFICLLGAHSLMSGPAWGLLTVIALTHLKHPERQFPLVRLGATLGWMSAGVMTSFVFHADSSPRAGYVSAGVKIIAGACALLLPETPPLGRGRNWKSLLGIDAFRLLRQRDHLVFFTTTACFSIPLAAFYMYAPEHLKMLGDRHPTATMTIAQWSEVIAMLALGSVLVRFRIKHILMLALGLSFLRFSMSAWAGWSGIIGWHIGGIALHGICYTFYFTTAQVFLDKRVPPEMRGQAQGLLALMSSGLGPLIGAALCGMLRQHFVRDTGEGWLPFWSILASIIGACFLWFTLCYRGLAGMRHEETKPAG